MMEVKVTIELLGIPEAINNLAAAICDRKASPSAPSAPSFAAVDTTVTKSAQTPVPTPEQASQKKITTEDISRAGAALVDAGKMADVINLLGRYGVQAITQLSADVYPTFANDLRALGADI